MERSCCARTALALSAQLQSLTPASLPALQAYLDKHEVQTKLNDVLNDLVHALPTDPLAWMANKLAEAGGAGSVSTVPSVGAAAEDVVLSGLPARWTCALAYQAPPGGAKSSAPAPAAASSKTAAPAAPPAEAAAAADPAKEAKKAAKAEEKRKKEEEKERKRKEREEAEKKKLAGPEVPDVTLLNFMDHEFGQLLIQSHCTTDRKV